MSDLHTYRNMLRVNKHRLDDELELQADVMDRISQMVNKLNAIMLEAKEDLTRTEARLMVEIEEESTTKTTKDQREAVMVRHPDRKAAWSKYQRCRHEFDEWEALRDAWKQRGFSIKTLADLYTSHYFTIESYQGRDRQDRDQDRITKHQADHQERRAALSDARRGRTETAQKEEPPRIRRRRLDM